MQSPKCYISKYNSDFELVLSPDLLSVKTRNEDGYEWLWSSAKTNYGVKGGKYMYECRIKQVVRPENSRFSGFLLRSEMTEKTMDTFNQRHQVRIGWSTFTSKRNLGTDFEGIGYDNYGIKYYGGIQKPFGEMFTVGDTIRSCIDLRDTFTISYFKNGYYLGTAYKIPDRYQFKTFYPHVCVRNFELEMNFGSETEFYHIVSKQEALSQLKSLDSNDVNTSEKPMDSSNFLNSQGLNISKTNSILRSDLSENLLDLRKYQVDISEYEFIEKAPEYEKEFENYDPELCEQRIMIMMIGLPSSGKTTYATNYVNYAKFNIFFFLNPAFKPANLNLRSLKMRKNPEKNFILLSNFEIFDHIINTLLIPRLKAQFILFLISPYPEIIKFPFEPH